MRRGESRDWRGILVLIGLAGLILPAWAQAILPVEVMLNNVTLNSTYVEVLTRHGLPHYIGPCVTGAAAITQLLNSQPMPAAPTEPANAGNAAVEPHRTRRWPRSTGAGTGSARPHPRDCQRAEAAYGLAL